MYSREERSPFLEEGIDHLIRQKARRGRSEILLGESAGGGRKSGRMSDNEAIGIKLGARSAGLLHLAPKRV